MYRIPIEFHRRLLRGEKPVHYIVVETHMGLRAYSRKELTSIFDRSSLIADGLVLADGSEVAGGGYGYIDKAGRLLETSSLERTIQPQNSNVLAAYQGKQLQHLSATLDNFDRYFSRLIAREPFLGRPLQYYLGYEDMAISSHISFFYGIIVEISGINRLVLEAEER